MYSIACIRSGGIIIATKHTGLAVTCCALVLASAAVACGTEEKLDAGAKVERAFERLGEERAVAVEFALDANADAVHAALKDGKDGKDGVDREAAGILAGLKVRYAVVSDRPLKEQDGGEDAHRASAAGRLAKKDGTVLAELRSVDRKMYLRGDLKAFAGMVKPKNAEERSERRDFDEALKRIDRMPDSLAAVRNALKGEWVVLDAREFEELAKKKRERGGGQGDADSSGELDAATRKRVADAFRKTLTDNSTVKDAGTRNGAEHMKVTVPARKAAGQLSEALKPLEKRLRAAGKGKDLGALDKAPDRDVVFDVALKGGRLSAVTVDMAALDKDVRAPLPLTVGFDSTSVKVDAPSGARKLSAREMTEALMRMVGADADRPGGADRRL
ncbi:MULTISPECIES: hypothetical protein [Streptomyces]|uniref:hypothetical protein n=1 Tax=Streptomyces TaxID=1883 RepID=UPI00163C0828|nr:MULTISPECIES: hypothetical protein [Streptomyces]MBC2874354.1 hypothetical protein [Streptomyces sp. TYQ1024]UBI40388.1 hypothetical protein K7I03_30675 [Streptomyces mobaraensis]UKW32970.1 hypothetical protein MCU78_30595 [Streptomyces sp. TYQ1024]